MKEGISQLHYYLWVVDTPMGYMELGDAITHTQVQYTDTPYMVYQTPSTIADTTI